MLHPKQATSRNVFRLSMRRRRIILHEYFDTGLGKFYFVVHEYCKMHNVSEQLSWPFRFEFYYGELKEPRKTRVIKLAKIKHSTVL